MDPTVEEGIVRSVIGRTTLTDTEISLIIRIFKYYDTDNDSYLTRDEASLMLAELGYGSSAWSQKRVPMEEFLLRCGQRKKEEGEDKEDVENGANHAFRMLDMPATGTVNQHKLKVFLREVEFGELDDDVIERLSELISSGDGTDFTQDDLYVYIANNMKMAEAFANVEEGEAGVNKVKGDGTRKGIGGD